MASISLLIWTLCIFVGARGYSTGILPPAREACASMFPRGHGAQAQKSNSPFIIKVSHTSYSEHRTLTVTLESRCGNQFKGFLVQARRADPQLEQNEFIGTFSPVPYTRTVCGPSGSSGLTHTSNMTKSTLQFSWTAPHGLNDHIVFRATFVEDMLHFWENVTSPVVTGNVNIRFPFQSSWLTRTLYPCTVREAAFHLDHRCGGYMGCFHDCDAMDDCSVQVSWRDLGAGRDEIEFTIKTVIIGRGDKWAAVGFSTDTQMGWDSVVECVEVGTGIFVYPSYNYDKSNKRLQRFSDQPLLGVTPIAGSDRDGVFQCTFRRNKTIADDFRYFDLNKDFYMLVATGRATPDGNKSPHTVKPVASSVTIDLQNTYSVHVDTLPTARRSRPPQNSVQPQLPQGRSQGFPNTLQAQQQQQQNLQNNFQSQQRLQSIPNNGFF